MTGVVVATLATREPYLSMAAALRFELAQVEIPVVVHTSAMGEHPWQAKRHAIRSAFELHGGTVYWLDADCRVLNVTELEGLLRPRDRGVHVLRRVFHLPGLGRVSRRALWEVGAALAISTAELELPADWFWGVSCSREEAGRFFGAWDVVAKSLQAHGRNWGDAISVALATRAAGLPLCCSMREASFDAAIDHLRIGPADSTFQLTYPKGSK